LSQCFFGEHLLSQDKTKTVAIVESEKSAIIASMYLPGYIWLACGGSVGLSDDKCKCLKGRSVVLFPDVGVFGKWSEKAERLRDFFTVTVSDLLEKDATDNERADGLDLADYLLKFPLSEFVKPQQNVETEIFTYEDERGKLYCGAHPEKLGLKGKFILFDNANNQRSIKTG
jgi:hypothetical protein